MTGKSFLPIYDVIPKLISQLRRHSSVVLTASPGAGKTTRVPLALLDAGFLDKGQLVMLEPRRLAAKMAATFMADILGEKVGKTVGYRVRYEGVSGPSTKVMVLTEGILTRRLIEDPFLNGVDLVILDEFHERSLNLDLALSFLKETISVRSDLRVLVMSATMDARRVSDYLGGAPIIESSGRQYPLEVTYIPGNSQQSLTVQVACAVEQVVKMDEVGDVLVFLPGAKEIHEVADRLAGRLNHVAICPLYGAMDNKAQRQVFANTDKRKVVLATNIAETSLTVPGVRTVVDSGLVKIMKCTDSGLSRLETVQHTLFSATQRAGRAGREGPGRVFKLWARPGDDARHQETIPEIRRLCGAAVLLPMLSFANGPPDQFDLLDAPSDEQVTAGGELLRLLGALPKAGWGLTDFGKQMAALPLQPRLGAILLRAAQADRALEGALLVAILDEDELLEEGMTDDGDVAVSCDVGERARLVTRFVASGANQMAARTLGLRFGVVKRVVRLSRRLAQLVEGINRVSQFSGNLLAAGYPDRVAKKERPDDMEGIMSNGAGVRLNGGTRVLQHELLLVLDATSGRRGAHQWAKVRLASGVDEESLNALFPHLWCKTRSVVFDEATQRVVGVTKTQFLKLVVHEQRGGWVNAQEAGKVLVEAAKTDPDRAIKLDGAATAMVGRLQYAAAAWPQERWPDCSPRGLVDLLSQVAPNCRSFGDLHRIDWAKALCGFLPYELRARLDKWLPQNVQLPSGRKVPIDYEAGLVKGGTPGFAAPIQELFGLKATPTVGPDRVPLTVTLLSPARRPVQVTRDLASFWKNGYPAVRKELRARYAKHYWPEDPLIATPTRKACFRD